MGRNSPVKAMESLVLRRLLLVLLLSAAPAHAADLEIQALDAPVRNAPADAVAGGAFDTRLGPFELRELRKTGEPFWVKVRCIEDCAPAGAPSLVVHKGRHLQVELFPSGSGENASLPRAGELPRFRGVHDAVFVLQGSPADGESWYARITPQGRGAEELGFAVASLDRVLGAAAEHARMIAMTFGALMAMALAALLIWFVLSDRLFVLYALLISLQALYIAYLSGQGFEWPLLSMMPLSPHAWNVPAALSGAAACLFVREIADLKRFSPRVYAAFGWLAAAFLVLSFANLAELVGLGRLVVVIGNLIFVGAAIFTVVVAFLAWRRGSRAAGWFLVAWGLLEAATITTAVQLLLRNEERAELLLYYGLPLSMVVAAVFIALGVADRLREQRAALTEAERRAQTDPLTGVLNRRSIVERLEAASARARARGLPIALLFIDLDHFKQINDTYGHAAGDACLKAIVEPIQAELRQSDVIGRYGGEEFVVILSSADAEAAHLIAQRILDRVAQAQVEGFGKPLCLTCSIGVAASDTLGVWGEHLIARADEAQYAAKKSGRNRVQIAMPLAA
jgi:two-component system, sensor histidine kinase LadS